MKLSLLSLSFCSILSSRRLPLTPLSFVPPGSWCVLSGGRGGVGGWGDEEEEEEGGRERSRSSRELLMLI